VNLIIDIGNTTTKLALFDRDTLVDVYTEQGVSFGNLSSLIEKYKVDAGIMASVAGVPQHLADQLKSCGVPFLWLDHTTSLPINNLYKTPETLGMDRIAAAVGAWTQHPGHDILVVDAGTAITYEFVDSQGNYHGGNISPGMDVRFKSLNHYTKGLPLVHPEGDCPEIGYNTETAIRAGVMIGLEYEITGYIKSLKHKYPELLVFLTGGNEFSFATKLKNVIFADRFLVLKGLNRILNYNNGRI